MQVIALKQGYFGKLRDPGEAFDVPDGAQASWFEALDQGLPDPAPKSVPRSRKRTETPTDDML